MDHAEVDILRELLAAGNGCVSGNRLAKKLGVSRVTVWSWMDRLRHSGFTLEARPRAGYRLAAIPERLSRLYLQAAQPGDPASVPLFVHEEIDSTNSEAERLLARGQNAPFAVLAVRQTQGRGRRGRSWFSGDEGNLYLSLAFRPELPPARMGTFTLWMGVALCHFLNETTGAPVRLKWPNDLMLEGRKLGGILTEARIDSDQMRELVFGLGLNINGNPPDWPPDIRGTATSLRHGLGVPLSLNPLTASLLQQALVAYRQFLANPPPESLHTLWDRYDLLAGRQVTARQGNEPVTGRAEGIDGEGCLLLRKDDGAVLRLHAGDVTLRNGCST